MKNFQNISNLYQKLIKDTYKYSFFQTCFLFEKIYSQKKHFAEGIASSEPLRLIPYIYAATPKSSCIKFDKDRNALIVNIPTLVGYNGVLPTYYAEKVFFQEKQGNFLLSDFFNIFHHRHFSIKYRLEKNYNQTLLNEKFQEVSCISGITEKMKNNLIPFTSLLISKIKTTNNLKCLIQNLVKTEVEIKEFKEKWFKIPYKNQLKLNGDLLNEKAIGNKTKVNHQAVQIILIFEDFKSYMVYLDDEFKRNNVKKIIKYFLNGELEFDIVLKIKKYTTKTFYLNTNNKIGLTTWL